MDNAKNQQTGNQVPFEVFKTRLFAYDDAFKSYRERDLMQMYSDRHRFSFEEPGHTNSETVSVSYACVSCGGTLRIRIPQSDATYRCPSCKTAYKTLKAGAAPLVFLVVPELGRSAGTSQRPKREVPREVRAALAVFSLDEAATFEQVRAAFRELVKSYHPDKVAHLGAELRRVAEMKTKEINSAYGVLEKFYAP